MLTETVINFSETIQNCLFSTDDGLQNGPGQHRNLQGTPTLSQVLFVVEMGPSSLFFVAEMFLRRPDAPEPIEVRLKAQNTRREKEKFHF